MTPSPYPECVFSRWPEYQLPLTGSPPSVWFLSLCLHLPFNSFKRLCGARCGGTVACNCKSSLGRWKQEDQEFRVILGYRESSNPVWYAWVSSSKQNRVSEGRTLGCRWCSSGGSLQGRMSVPSSQGIAFNPADRQLKFPMLTWNKVLVPLWSPVIEQTTLDTSKAWLHYCGAYMCNNQWTGFRGVQKSRLSSW